MQSKKNPQSDLRNYSSLLFAFGLCLVLLVSWRAIEAKTYEAQYDYESLNVDDDDDEEIPITEQIKTPPPPPPPPAPEIIEVVEDEEEIEETIIESTETDQEEIVEEVEVMEEELDLDIPFAIIEDVPLFPGCERVAKSQRRKCFQEKIMKHINKNFSGIRTRGPDKNLEKEANRIISKLPKMTPGKQRGRPVRVPFSIPITFRLQ
jgi:protein TonB